MMTEVFSTTDMPTKRLYVKASFALWNTTDLGRAISIGKQNMARQIAEMVVADDTFFKSQGDGLYVHYFANVIVMTDDELARIQREAFDAGLRHARGFFPMEVAK